MLIIRTAAHADTESIIALRIAAEERLHACGIDQWRDRARGIINIKDGIEAQQTFAIVETLNTNTVVATITLAGPDPDWWHPGDDPDKGLYLYKFIISDSWRGTGLGDEILDWACSQAIINGKQQLRLDCWRTNFKLHDY